VRRRRLLLPYLLTDFLASGAAWFVFWLIRIRYYILTDTDELLITWAEVGKVTVIGVFWVLLHLVYGLYNEPYRGSRLKELGRVFQMSLVGSVFVFFVTFLDDPVPRYTAFRNLIVGYFGVQFLSVGVLRFILSSQIKKRMAAGRLGFRTVIIGSGHRAQALLAELQATRRKPGFLIKGFVSVSPADENLFYGKLKHLGSLENLRDLLRNRKIEEVIIALDSADHRRFLDVVNACEGADVGIYVVPDMYDYMVGNVRMTSLADLPLVRVTPHIISPGVRLLKRSIDVVVSILTLIVTAPMFLVLAILTKLDSKGPIFFLQERLGRGGKPFKIIKFRTMYIDAEKFGPLLTKDNDPRVTRVGRVIRKFRLDEFPQFVNVLLGQMSLVGPRPERKYYIDQIIERAPEYRHLQKVKPGITSWGQVKYGYAENIDQMIERLRYDIIYIENMSIAFDLKIIAYTVLTVVEGRGK